MHRASFIFASSIAIDRKGYVYVVDRGKKCVQKFTSSGLFVSKFGSYGSGNGQFINPEGIAIDAQDQLYICDQSRFIQKFTSQGDYLSKFGGFGAENGKFYWPTAICIDGEANLYVVDKAKHCIQKFTKEGIFLEKVGKYGTMEGELFSPEDIAVDTEDNLYVADTKNNRIQKFSPLRKPALRVMVDTSLVPNHTVYRLDTTTYGNTVEVNCTLDNRTGTAPLVLGNVVLPQNSKIIGDLPHTIAAGASQRLILQITAQQSGKYRGSFSFTSNDPVHSSYTIDLEVYVKKAAQEITFNPIPGKIYGQPAFLLTASVPSGLPIHYTSSNESVAVIEDNVVRLVGAGTATLQAMQRGDTNYLPAQVVSQHLLVEKALQSIQFEAISSLTYNSVNRN